MTTFYTQWIKETQFLARRRDLYEATGMMASEIRDKILQGTTKFQDRLYRVDVEDNFGQEQSLHIVYANVPPGSPELTALNADVQFMLSVSAGKSQSWPVGQPAPENVKVEMFRGRKGMFRSKSAAPEKIVDYIVKWMNDNEALLRGKTTAKEWVEPALEGELDEAASTLVTKIFAKFHANQKSKSGGKYTVMLTGSSAEVLGKNSYDSVNLADLSDGDLRKLASLFKIQTESAPLREQAGEGSVAKFLVVLGSKLTQYDVRLSAMERKRGRVNIYRLGHYMGALQKVRDDVASFETESSPEAIGKFMTAVGDYFDVLMPPVKNMMDQADAWTSKGIPPRLK